MLHRIRRGGSGAAVRCRAPVRLLAGESRPLRSTELLPLRPESDPCAAAEISFDDLIGPGEQSRRECQYSNLLTFDTNAMSRLANQLARVICPTRANHFTSSRAGTDCRPRELPKNRCAKKLILRAIQAGWRDPALSLKKFSFRFSEICDCLRVSRAHKRGVSRSSRTLGAGCGGRGGVTDEHADCGWRSRVVLIPRRWDQPPGQEPGGTVAKKPGHRGEHV
jgi:hypothetical protein